MSCAPQPYVAACRRRRHRVRLDEAIISSRGGATILGLDERKKALPDVLVDAIAGALSRP